MSSRSPGKDHPQQPDAIQKRICAAKEAKIVMKTGFGSGCLRGWEDNERMGFTQDSPLFCRGCLVMDCFSKIN
jgi:hypothetical protein